MRSWHYYRRGAYRKGITLVEVILVILGVLLLLSFLLPSVRSAGSAARRAQCFNNLKNLSLAASNYAYVHGGYLPSLSSAIPGSTTTSDQVTWGVTQFPYLDRADIHEFIREAKTPAAATKRMHEVQKTEYSFLQCPGDAGRSRQPGQINYAANVGYGAWTGRNSSAGNGFDGIVTRYDFHAKDHSLVSIDWNGNGKPDNEDATVAASTGVFWNSMPGKRGLSLDEITHADGTSSTLLLVESVKLPLMYETGPLKNGLNPGALQIGSGLGYSSLGLQKQSPPSLEARLMSETPEFRTYFKPNASVGQATGTWLGASSNHKGIVNVVFAGGNATSISQDVDWKVWAALHSPNGINWGERRIQDNEY